jgi:hypothetical protein
MLDLLSQNYGNGPETENIKSRLYMLSQTLTFHFLFDFFPTKWISLVWPFFITEISSPRFISGLNREEALVAFQHAFYKNILVNLA